MNNRMDNVFGPLTWDGLGWNRETGLDWFGDTESVEVYVKNERKEDPISDLQKESYKTFMEKWSGIKEEVLNRIFIYYQEEREENGEYPAAASPEALLDWITLSCISIDDTELLEDFYDGDRCVSLLFSCSWDEENGFGVALVNEEVVEIGPDVGL